MAYCSQCGAQIAAGSRFCPQCGAAQTADTAVTTPVTTYTTPATSYAAADNSVMLVSLGTCDAETAAYVLQETCGYTLADARQIVASAPITLARDLTDTQAAVLAQAIEEYGMDATVFDSTGYRTVNPVYSSIFDTNGSLLASAAAVLGLIGAGNGITRAMMRRMDYPFGRPPHMNMPRRPVPPPRPMMHQPEPRPMMHQPEPRPMGGQSMHREEPGRGQIGRPNGGFGGPDRGSSGRGGQGGPGGRGGQGGPGFGGPGRR